MYALQLNKKKEYTPSLEKQLGVIFAYHREKYKEPEVYMIGPVKIKDQTLVKAGEVYIEL